MTSLFSYALTIMLLSLWLGMTIIVDFFAIPAVFQTVPDLKVAGEVGMKVFSRFNWVELIFGLILLAFGIKKAKRSFLSWLFSLGLLFLASFYLFYLTPQLIDLTELKYSLTASPEVRAQAALDHDFLHKLYVRLDGLKIFLLLGWLTQLMLQLKKSKGPAL